MLQWALHGKRLHHLREILSDVVNFYGPIKSAVSSFPQRAVNLGATAAAQVTVHKENISIILRWNQLPCYTTR